MNPVCTNPALNIGEFLDNLGYIEVEDEILEDETCESFIPRRLNHDQIQNIYQEARDHLNLEEIQELVESIVSSAEFISTKVNKETCPDSFAFDLKSKYII